MNDNLGLVFSDGINLFNVNPDNNALKNTYIDNLISTSLLVIPEVANEIGESPDIVRGFLSRKKLYEENNGSKKMTPWDSRHTKGLALELSWKNYDTIKSMAIAKKFFNECDTELEIVVTNTSLCFYRGVKKRKVVRKFDEKSFSTILKK